MAIKVTCPECGAKYRVKDERAGMKLACTQCQAVLRVPGQPKKSESGEKPDATTANVPSGKWRRVKLAVRIGLVALLVALVVMGIWEYRARSGYAQTLDSLRAAMHAKSALREDDIEDHVSGSATVKKVGEPGYRMVVLTWAGVFQNYEIGLTVGRADEVIALDTGADLERELESKKGADVGRRVAQGNASKSPATPKPKPKPTPRTVAPRKSSVSRKKSIADRAAWSNLNGLARRLGIVVNVPRPEQLKPDPEILAKVRKLFTQSPRSALPKTQKPNYPGKPPQEQLYRWMLKDTVKAYRMFGRKDPKWDSVAIDFLTKLSQLLAGYPGRPTREAVIRLGRKALDTGCDDPLVLCYCAVVFRQQPAQFGESIKLFQKAFQVLPDTKYPPRCRFVLEDGYARLLWYSGKRTLADNARRRCIREFAKAAAAKDLTGPVRRSLWFRIDRLMSSSVSLGRYRAILGEALYKDADSWIAYMVGAQSSYVNAWRARGGGYANTVTRERMALFKIFMKQAQKYALVAWDLHPDYPEAASILIQITMAIGGVAGEDERFWFDQAVKAQFDYQPAYTSLRWALRPRWGGSHEQMLQFARECLDTNRWDTDVPWQFHLVVRDIASESDDKLAIYRLPGVFAGYQKLFTEARKVAASVQEKNRRSTQLASAMWLSGRKVEANKLLDSLGTGIDTTVFSQYFPVSLAEIRSDRGAKPTKKKP